MSGRVLLAKRAASLGALAALGLALVGLAPVRVAAIPDEYGLVEHGRALATAGDCIACHTPAGGQPFAGGRDLATPFGVIRTPNLTPDVASGIGSWSADDFYRALHEGRRPDGSHLYPAFPYPSYTKLTRADSDAIFAFMRRLPPKANTVDRDTLPFPFDIRRTMIGWNLLFFQEGEFKADPAHSAEYNQGAYLTEALGHCGACHTPRNGLGASKASHSLEGGVVQGWTAPNITNVDRVGLGRWSLEDITEYLRTGHNAQAAAGGPMAEVVSYSTAAMTDGERHAIAVYLKERGGVADVAPAPISSGDARMRAGAAIYVDTCMACHQRDGSGVDRLFPRLAGSAAVQQDDPTSLVRVVIQGSKSVATYPAPTAPAMPSLGWRLSDDEVANVLTYIRNNWGNRAPAVTAADVGSIQKASDLRAER